MELKGKNLTFFNNEIKNGETKQRALKNLVILMGEKNAKMGVELNALSFITIGEAFEIINEAYKNKH